MVGYIVVTPFTLPKGYGFIVHDSASQIDSFRTYLGPDVPNSLAEFRDSVGRLGDVEFRTDFLDEAVAEQFRTAFESVSRA